MTFANNFPSSITQEAMDVANGIKMELNDTDGESNFTDEQIKCENLIFIKEEPSVDQDNSKLEPVTSPLTAKTSAYLNRIKFESEILSSNLTEYKPDFKLEPIDDIAGIYIKIEPLISEEVNLKGEGLDTSTLNFSRAEKQITSPYDYDYDFDGATNKFVCTVCGYKNTRLSKVKVHFMIHTGHKPHQCELCGYKTVWKVDLNEHVRNHSGIKHLQCPHCEFKTGRRQNLRNHLLRHSTEVPFGCPFCEFKTKYRKNMLRHIERHDRGQFKCTECNYTATCQRNWEGHMKTHTVERYFQCNNCNYRSTEKSALRVHVQIHSANKPLQCSHCDYRTVLKQTLAKHIHTHSTEKIFKCLGCSFSAKAKYTLELHKKKMGHMNESYSCDKCDYTTDSQRVLQWHLKTHTGQKLFECDQCEYKTNCSSNLRKHVALHSRNSSNN